MTGFLPENPGVIDVEEVAETGDCILWRKQPSVNWPNNSNYPAPTIRKHLHTLDEPVYPVRKSQPHPKLGPFRTQLEQWPESDSRLPAKRRCTAQRLFECLQVEGYVGGYCAVRRYVKTWKHEQTVSPPVTQVFVPLYFSPGETCQFDWSHETAVIGGVEQVVKVAQFRLTYSR